MNILFVMKHAGSVRNFESAVRMLAGRHRIHLAFDSHAGGIGRATVELLRRELTSLSFGPAPRARHRLWGPLLEELRLGIDFLRYLEPRYAKAPKLRARAEQQAPMRVRGLARLPLLRTPAGVRALMRLLQSVERALPHAPVDEYIVQQRPDILLVTPLVGLGSRQADYVRSARRLGIRSGLLVHSWDNLTNKGLMRDVPDLVTVWNEVQKREAVELHGAPPDRVAVTGASAYDHWFDWKPSSRRDEFCRRVGLRDDRPFLLYLCSSPFVGPQEAAFVTAWARRLRGGGDPSLREAGILVRPHPQNAEQWAAVGDLPGQVAVFPREGADPLNLRAKADYFDSIHHSAAVVGLNTSGLIETAIVGRPVYTWLAPEYRETQEGTLHFHYLPRVNGGPLNVADSFEEHASQLARALAGPEPDFAERNRAFLERFVRPFGLDQPATPRLVEAIERAAGVPGRKHPAGLLARATRAALLPAARYLRRRRDRVREAASGAKWDRRALGGDEARRRPALPDPAADGLAALALAAQGDGPVLAGPFLGEVGYELLYWIPFLARGVAEHPALRDRTTVVTRGGAGCWYEHVAARAVDVFEYVGLEEYQARRQELVKGGQKQFAVHPFEQELLARTRDQLGLQGATLLHPSAMFQVYWRLYKREALAQFERLGRYQLLQRPELASLAGHLPKDYVAVRFYFNASLPDTRTNREFIASMLSTLGETTDVVMLNTALLLDDHREFEKPRSPRVFSVERLITPRDNLEVQSAVIAGARAFVGTYGGLAYLPPLLGVPSLSFYSDPGRFRQDHLELAQRVFKGRPFGRFAALDVGHMELVHSMLQSTLATARP